MQIIRIYAKLIQSAFYFMNCQQHSGQIIAGLRQKKIKVTPSRLLLLDVFAHAEKPLNAAQALAALGGRGADQSTVYRNLESLADLGLLTRLSLRSRQAYYELSDSLSEKNHHHHLVCVRCSKVVEITDCHVRAPGPGAVKRAGFFVINDHALEFFGLCKKCVEKKSFK